MKLNQNLNQKKTVCLLLLFVFFALSYSGGAQTLSLNDALRNLESAENGAAELYWDPFLNSGYISIGAHRVSFYTGNAGETGPVLFDNREVAYLPLPYSENGGLYFPESMIQRLKDSFLRYEEEDRDKYRIAAIVIDPGHGGRDPGAITNRVINGRNVNLQEKDINLKVSRLLYNRLNAAFPGKRILMTREGDTFPSLDDRARMANSVPMHDNEAVIFISIHTNSSLSRNANGYEIYYLYPEYRRELLDSSSFQGTKELLPILNDMMEEEVTTQSIKLANSIHRNFERIIGNTIVSRGVKEKDYYVVRNARMPSVLVELGFLTNDNDVRYLADDSYLNNFAEALYKGISDFVAVYEQ